MKKHRFVCLPAAALLLAFFLALVGCSNPAGTTVAEDSPRTYTGTSNGNTVTITIYRSDPDAKAVLSPKSGDYYKIWENNTLVSSGKITVSGSKITFKPGSNSPGANKTEFTAEIVSGGDSTASSINNLTVPGTSISNVGATETTGSNPGTNPGSNKPSGGGGGGGGGSQNTTVQKSFDAEQFIKYFADDKSDIYNTPGNYVITLTEDLEDFSGANLGKEGVNITVKGDKADREITFKYSDSVGHSLFSVEGGKLTLENIKLSRSADDDKADWPLLYVGGTLEKWGTLEIKNGVELSNDNGTVPAPGVWLFTGKFIMSGGTIKNCTTGVGTGIVATAVKASIEITGGTISDNKAPGILIGDDSEDCTVNIKGGTISGNDGEGVHVYGTSNQVSMTNGEISGNNNGIGLEGTALSFTMSGGKIINNANNGIDLWSVNSDKCTVSITGGTISGNEEGLHIRGKGGKVTISGTANISDNKVFGIKLDEASEDCELTIDNGKITGGTTTKVGLLIKGTGNKVFMKGGEISGNSEGVLVQDNSPDGPGVGGNNSFIMSGGVISKNSNVGLSLSGANSSFETKSSAVIYGKDAGSNSNGNVAIDVICENNQANNRHLLVDAGSNEVYAATINADKTDVTNLQGSNWVQP